MNGSRRRVSLKVQPIQPLPVRTLHWLFVAAVAALLSSGLYINRPRRNAAFRMSGARLVHLEAAWVGIGVILARIYYALATRDYLNILPNREDVRRLPQLMRYVAFLADKLPPHGKYNPGQKFIFSSFYGAFLAQAVTGLALYGPRQQWLARALGGLPRVRLLHYLVAVYFLTIAVHVYLALAEDPAKLQAMFSGRIRVRSKRAQAVRDLNAQVEHYRRRLRQFIAW